MDNRLKGIFLASIAALVVGCSPAPAESPQAEEEPKVETPVPTEEPVVKGMESISDTVVVGKEAPDFTIKDADGVKWKLSDYRGKTVLLDFWAFW